MIENVNNIYLVLFIFSKDLRTAVPIGAGSRQVKADTVDLVNAN